jgi:hypothetical protein
MKKQNLIGQVFGQLTVIATAPSRNGLSHWICQCTCGNSSEVSQSNLKKGTTKSCGCFRKVVAKENMKTRFVTHGDHGTRLHSLWLGMRKRCYTTSSTAYAQYGGKGITVSSHWDSYENFKAWALQNGYVDGLSLDRINSSGNYTPRNCRWVSVEAQIRNRRKTSKPSSSTYIGVSWHARSQTWVAHVTVTKRTYLVGYFDDEVSAAQARDAYITSRGLPYFKLNF